MTLPERERWRFTGRDGGLLTWELIYCPDWARYGLMEVPRRAVAPADFWGSRG